MSEKGMVVLVGAGPGDTGLLTLAGKEALESADIVLFDRLVGDGILDMLPNHAEKIDVGKNKGCHPVPQEEINAMIVRYALDGKRVVRLKGGDPYLFGRGAEELEAVVREGISFRVIPGVSSAMAAPAYAGIPVTHRDYASSVHILTGHRKNGLPPDIPYQELSRLNGTLVFLMSLSACGEICEGLIAAGSDGNTPAALIENGTRANQRRLTGTLATLPALAKKENFASPALMVVGVVCELAERFDWRESLPLGKKTVLTVSTQETAGRLAALLRDQGCAVDAFAGIRTVPLRLPETLWTSFPEYAWIVFTSRTGVDCFFHALAERKTDLRSIAGARFAVVGRQTGDTLARYGIYADLVPGEYSGKALGDALAEKARADEKILLFRARDGGGDLPDALRGRGLRFDDVAAYRTETNAMPQEFTEKLLSGKYDGITFASASAVESFVSAFPGGGKRHVVFCIGEMTAAAAKKHDMAPIISREATIDSLASLVLETIGKS